MDNFVKTLKEAWFLIAFIVFMVLWYGSVNTRLEAVETKQLEQQAILDKINQLVIDVAVIKNDVATIKEVLK